MSWREILSWLRRYSKPVGAWMWQVLVALDQFCNALFAPLLNLGLRPGAARFGFPDESLSSVMGKNVRAGHCRGCRWICRLLHRADPHHCEKSIEADEGDKA